MPSGLLRHYVCMYACMYLYLQGGLSLYICNKLANQFVCGNDRGFTLFLLLYTGLLSMYALLMKQ